MEDAAARHRFALLRATLMSHRTLRGMGLRPNDAVINELSIPAPPAHPANAVRVSRRSSHRFRFGPEVGGVSGFTDRANRRLPPMEPSAPIAPSAPPSADPKPADIFRHTALTEQRRVDDLRDKAVGALQRQAGHLRRGEGWAEERRSSRRASRRGPPPAMGKKAAAGPQKLLQSPMPFGLCTPTSPSILSGQTGKVSAAAEARAQAVREKQESRAVARAVAAKLDYLRVCSDDERAEFQATCDAWAAERAARGRRGCNHVSRNTTKAVLRKFLPSLRLEEVHRRAGERMRHVQEVRESAVASLRDRQSGRAECVKTSARRGAYAETLGMKEAALRVFVQRWQPVLCLWQSSKKLCHALDVHRNCLGKLITARQRHAVAAIEDWWVQARDVRKGKDCVMRIRTRNYILRKTKKWVASARAREMLNKHNLVTQFLRDFATSRRFMTAVHRYISRTRAVQRAFRKFAGAKRAKLELWTMQWMRVEEAMRVSHLQEVKRDISRHRIGQTQSVVITSPRAGPTSPRGLLRSPLSAGSGGFEALPTRSRLKSPTSPGQLSVDTASPRGNKPKRSSQASFTEVVPRKPNLPVSVYKRLVGQPAVPLDLRDAVLERELCMCSHAWARRLMRWERQVAVFEEEMESWDAGRAHFTKTGDLVALEAMKACRPIEPPPRPRLPLMLSPEDLSGLIERTVKAVAEEIAERVRRKLTAVRRVGQFAQMLVRRPSLYQPQSPSADAGLAAAPAVTTTLSAPSSGPPLPSPVPAPCSPEGHSPATGVITAPARLGVADRRASRQSQAEARRSVVDEQRRQSHTTDAEAQLDDEDADPWAQQSQQPKRKMRWPGTAFELERERAERDSQAETERSSATGDFEQ
eukprot:TRINITY_DN11592_c0_g1_i1.p1 TRINITY_DN11592_c0_g1~~TRINITY_DN11592_c0_g1_i1.p1  ORF type:complete len:920 (+),score=308.62 TRINITY_DN11592_c0_g1_i1:158-2761(+)